MEINKKELKKVLVEQRKEYVNLWRVYTLQATNATLNVACVKRIKK